MELASPTTRTRNYNLDVPPPQPTKSQGGSFMAPPTTGGGVGDMINSPHLMTMQGLAMVKDGCQLIANGLPDLSQVMSNTIADFEQLITQSMAATMAGQQQPVTPPPGVAPAMAPPPPGPGAAAPSAASMGGMVGAPGGPPGPMGM